MNRRQFENASFAVFSQESFPKTVIWNPLLQHHYLETWLQSATDRIDKEGLWKKVWRWDKYSAVWSQWSDVQPKFQKVWTMWKMWIKTEHNDLQIYQTNISFIRITFFFFWSWVLYVWTSKDAAFSTNSIVPAVMHSSGGTILWRCFTLSGTGKLQKIDVKTKKWDHFCNHRICARKLQNSNQNSAKSFLITNKSISRWGGTSC